MKSKEEVLDFANIIKEAIPVWKWYDIGYLYELIKSSLPKDAAAKVYATGPSLFPIDLDFPQSNEKAKFGQVGWDIKKIKNGYTVHIVENSGDKKYEINITSMGKKLYVTYSYKINNKTMLKYSFQTDFVTFAAEVEENNGYNG